MHFPILEKHDPNAVSVLENDKREGDEANYAQSSLRDYRHSSGGL